MLSHRQKSGPIPWRSAAVPLSAVFLVLFALSCNHDIPSTARAAAPEPVQREQPEGDESPPALRQVRTTGTVRAVRALIVKVPRISGRQSRFTLTKLAPNGSTVREGDILIEFDRTEQFDTAREAEAKYEDLGHQVEQKFAENRAEVEKRLMAIEEAGADLAKARIQLRKGPVLSEIERLKAEVSAAGAETRVESLNKSHRYHEEAEAAALRILELQRDRQKVALERAVHNIEKLQLLAPHGGMVALSPIWRNGSIGHAQEGDQLYRGRVILRVFDPTEMELHAYVAETDGATLAPGRRAEVILDAYPDLKLTARLVTVSPVAASAMGSPIKAFFARFRLDQTYPNLLPDLSAAVTILAEDES